ncbi:hypothetical protein DL771_012059 [Monosporascus sp. 5C6A]|nr:hypothetical protein DL771_012059 [Monosporascus sp. 5C6A]
MGFLSTLLPKQEGILPYFLVYTGLSAAIHTVACYTSKPSTALRVFSGPEAPPAHPLLAHTYGVKNIYASLIRFYGAYYITNPQVYDLTTCTFGGVLFLYVTEVYVYKTARLREAIIPFVTAGSALLWMTMQRNCMSTKLNHTTWPHLVHRLIAIVILGLDLGIDYDLLVSSQTPRFVPGHLMTTTLGREHRVPFGQSFTMRAILESSSGPNTTLLLLLVQKLKQLRAGFNGSLLHPAEKRLSSFDSTDSDEATRYPLVSPLTFGQHLDRGPGRSSGKSLKGPGSLVFLLASTCAISRPRISLFIWASSVKCGEGEWGEGVVRRRLWDRASLFYCAPIRKLLQSWVLSPGSTLSWGLLAGCRSTRSSSGRRGHGVLHTVFCPRRFELG